MKPVFILSFLLLLIAGRPAAQSSKTVREYFQLQVFHYTSPEQEQQLDRYLQNALLPALHRLKYQRIGVFKALANDTATDKKIYVIIPFRELQRWPQLSDQLQKDRTYLQAAADEQNSPNKAGIYNRIETILLKSFSKAPLLEVPRLEGDKAQRVYELRSYESSSGKRFRNKVAMFNDGDEIGIFKQLGFNAVFYGEVLAGSRMPNLMYMTTHASMEARNQNWKNFGSDPAWKKLNAMEAYKDNVSRIDISFLKATSYSDL
ncbi:NIPSNAP family protein [Niabella drilacis]|uniref:NIPSNAP protein n=1 Tax=Niabella drilacis (strain DSM 25811 / CCM 8410 / CCUG 62505 / LMG 26954 / E90) TaxID=1285928 RepID=A0A1G6NJW4_NIADE|nr:NIPSNAP family protein [Niabella drilacis]SDC68290.1 NIPSNAP protein [Niabella drilacis]